MYNNPIELTERGREKQRDSFLNPSIHTLVQNDKYHDYYDMLSFLYWCSITLSCLQKERLQKEKSHWFGFLATISIANYCAAMTFWMMLCACACACNHKRRRSFTNIQLDKFAWVMWWVQFKKMRRCKIRYVQSYKHDDDEDDRYTKINTIVHCLVCNISSRRFHSTLM